MALVKSSFFGFIVKKLYSLIFISFELDYKIIKSNLTEEIIKSKNKFLFGSKRKLGRILFILKKSASLAIKVWRSEQILRSY